MMISSCLSLLFGEMMEYNDSSYTRHARVCRFNTIIDEQLHSDFRKMCTELDISIKEAVDTMVRQYLEEYNLQSDSSSSAELTKKQRILQDDAIADKEFKRIIMAYTNLINLKKGR